MIPNYSDIVCTHCFSNDHMRYDYVQGYILCIACGFISTRTIIVPSFTPSTPSYDEDLYAGGLGTYFDDKPKECSTDLFVKRGKSKIKHWGWTLKLSTRIISESLKIFGKMVEEGGARTRKKGGIRRKRRDINTMVASVLYLTARSEGQEVFIKDLENLTGRKKGKIYKEVSRNYLYFEFGRCEACNLAEIFGGKLDLKYPLIKKIKELTKKIDESGVLEGKTKRNIAGVVIYSEVKEKNLEEISKVADIDAKTIKNTYDELIGRFGKFGLEIKENESLETVVKKMEGWGMKEN